MKPDARNRDLARIHLGATALGLDRDTYEQMLFAVGGPTARQNGAVSAANLDHVGRARVIEHLRSRGAYDASRGTRRRQNPEWGWVDRAAADRQPMLRKIIMQLRGAGRARPYVDGMCEKMKLPRLEFCGTQELHKIVSALNIDAGRRERTDGNAYR